MAETAPSASEPSLEASLATWDHDRVMPLHDGRVCVPGLRLVSRISPTQELFPLAVGSAPHDITEMSISSYVLQVARGEGAYVALPVFVSRAFRHSGFFLRRDAGIETLSDLAGRRVGVPEYQMTAALWMRGLLSDEYGVRARDVRWQTGALDGGVRRERLDLELPAGMEVRPIEEGRTLQDLLIDGEIDALLAPKPPRAFLEGDDRFVRAFPDYETAEQEYHRRTGFFPIMHVLGVRRTLAEAHPWLPRALYDACAEAKAIALDRLTEVWLGNANRLSLPWLNATMERTRAAFGNDWWPYGLAANRAELEAVCRYSVEQHLAPRAVAVEELFHPSVRDT
jgi:4,5-dihydroxyphthalate decarboxylase